MSDADQEPRQELAALVGAFRAHLVRSRDAGSAWVPAAPSARKGLKPLDVSAEAEAAVAAPEPAVGPDEARAPGASRPPGRPDLRLVEASPPAADPAPPAADPAPPVAGGRDAALQAVRDRLGDCQRCPLAGGRRHIVFGQGHPEAEVMFVGEAPGAEEDRQGLAFVGAAGRLLTRMLKAMGLDRDDVYICNIIKCRPPRNRDPAPEEVAACEPFLGQQIAAIGPRIIVAMGNFAARTLLQTDTGITRLRGRWGTYRGVPLMPTFHPAYLLRNPSAKRGAWEDLQAVMVEMDRLGLRRER